MNKIEKEPLVSIACITYNQDKYIRQCLDGFVMQKTNFKFEIVIHDDASTDNTPSIIREYCDRYPDLFVPILQTQNKYREGKGILIPYVYPKCKGKYIALCEGDDYWIDPLKLQKQVDFLEMNPGYGLVRTNVNRYNQSKNECDISLFSQQPYNKIKDTFHDYLYNAWFAAPCSWMFRAEFINKLPTKIYKVGDLPTLLSIARISKIKYFNDITAVYRVLNESASHFKSEKAHIEFIESIKTIQYDFAEKESIGVKIKLMLNVHINRLLLILSYLKRYGIYYLKGFKKDILFLLGK